MRIAFAALCAIALAAAAFISYSENTTQIRRTALADFDTRAREAVDALADLRAAEQAYVAPGQGAAFWIQKVDETSQSIESALTTLRQTATSTNAASEIEAASAAFARFRDVDRRIRGYVKSGALTMAADLVFSDGGQAAVKAARSVEQARMFERSRFESVDAYDRLAQLGAAAGVATLMLVTIFGFARRPRVTAPDTATAEQPAADRSVAPARSPVDVGELPLRGEAWAGDRSRPQAPAGAAADASKNGAFFKAVGELCTDIGRVTDLEQLRALLGRMAQLLDASGLVLWSASPSGAELQPALTHGYAPQTVARIPPVPYTADNAAAAAYRTGKLQIVPSRPGSSVKGAIVAPVISVDGCIGVLSAELRGGAETSDSVQAIAAILAAQLAGVVAAAPAQDAGRASGAASG